jgi:predicted house-cleaning noncanonical NTP pyrophosphatase (MazG superfamily)
MWFVGLLDGADSDCLPWFQATWETGRTENGPEAPSESAPRYVIASRADLEALPSSVLTGQVIQLKPDEELIRDKSFVDRIAEIAMERALLVEMDGSPLAHPFYMLRRAGVPVYCRTPIRITVSEQTPHNKLVRDHVPVLITEHGDHAVVYRADEIELRSRLRTKVVEEALELLAADTPEGELAEFADIFEVLQACVEATGFSTADVEVAQTQKRMERGGFEEGIVLVSTGEDDEPLVKEARTEALPGMPQSSSKRALITREGGGLDISLIPPERGDRSVYTMRLGDRIAEIRYFDSTVRLSIQPAASVQSAGFEQPDLWS